MVHDAILVLGLVVNYARQLKREQTWNTDSAYRVILQRRKDNWDRGTRTSGLQKSSIGLSGCVAQPCLFSIRAPKSADPMHKVTGATQRFGCHGLKRGVLGDPLRLAVTDLQTQVGRPLPQN